MTQTIYTEGHPGRRPGPYALQEKEQSFAFLAFPVVGKFGMSHLHPCLTCTLKVSPYLFEIFGTRSSFILYIYKILNLSCFLWMLYIGFFLFFLFGIVQSIHTIYLSGERSLCFFQEVYLVKVRRSRRPQWGAIIQAWSDQ